MPPRGSLQLTSIQNVGFLGLDIGAEPRASRDAMPVLSQRKRVLKCLRFSDSSGPLADQDPREPKGRINFWFSSAVTTLELALCATACPILPVRRSALENPVVGDFLAGSEGFQ